MLFVSTEPLIIRKIAGTFLASISVNPTLFLLNTVEIVGSSNEDLIIHSHRTGQGQAVQLVYSHDLKRRPGLHDSRRAVFAYAVDLSVRQERRRTVGSVFDTLPLVCYAAGCGLDAVHNPVVPEDINIFAVSGRRRHVSPKVVSPELALPGDVA